MADTYTIDLKYRALDKNGDMVMNGENAFLYKQEALMQSISTRIKLYAGEWWEGDDGAIAMFTDVIGRPRTAENKSTIDLLITARITDTIGVLEVTDVQSEFLPGRVYKYSCKVRTQYGTQSLEVSI